MNADVFERCLMSVRTGASSYLIVRVFMCAESYAMMSCRLTPSRKNLSVFQLPSSGPFQVNTRDGIIITLVRALSPHPLPLPCLPACLLCLPPSLTPSCLLPCPCFPAWTFGAVLFYYLASRQPSMSLNAGARTHHSHITTTTILQHLRRELLYSRTEHRHHIPNSVSPSALNPITRLPSRTSYLQIPP